MVLQTRDEFTNIAAVVINIIDDRKKGEAKKERNRVKKGEYLGMTMGTRPPPLLFSLLGTQLILKSLISMVEMDAYCMIIDSKMAFNCIFAVETLPSVPDVIQKLGLI